MVGPDATVPGGSRGILGFNAWDTNRQDCLRHELRFGNRTAVGREYVVQASYVGTQGRKNLGTFLDANQPTVSVV